MVIIAGDVAVGMFQIDTDLDDSDLAPQIIIDCRHRYIIRGISLVEDVF